VAALEVGRVCMKVAGREAGKYCVILKKLDNTFFLVTGPKQLTGVKRRRCNVEHLEPTSYSLKIDTEAPDERVIKAYDAIGLTKKLSLRLPSPEVMKEVEKKVKEIPKVEKPKEEKKPEKKPEEKVEKKEEKPKEKKGITLKFKIPTFGRKKPKEEKKVEKKPEKPKKEEKKPEKKPAKKPEKAAKKAKKKK
jgi:large subunit ribosomal protein L14e